MKKLIWLIILTMIMGILSESVLAVSAITLNPIVVDYNAGTVSISGVLGSGSGKRVTIEIKNQITSEVAYIDQITSTAGGKFALSFKFSRKYSTGTYVVSAIGSDIASSISSSFYFDSTSDVFTAQNVSIQGSSSNITIENEVLTGTYTYYSSFGYYEGASSYQWNMSGSSDGQYYPIEGSVNKTYSFKSEDAEKILTDHPELFSQDISHRKFYIKYSVKAKTEASAGFATEQFSAPVEARTLPYANNVTFEGSSIVGSTLTGNYNYHHLQGVKESLSSYAWLSSTSENGTYSEISNGITYIPKVSDVGKYIKFGVTPKAEQDPKDGVQVVSTNSVLISNKTTGGSSSSGGGGGSSTITIKGDVPIPTPLPIVTPAPTQKIFSDVPEGYWAKNDIDEVVTRGNAKGVSDNSFAPDGNVTRAQFAKLVLNVLNIKETQYSNSFQDVDKNEWYAGAVQSAVDKGLISGNDGNFRPEDSITREEMTKIIIEAYKIGKGNPPATQDNQNFKDRQDISNWANEYITAACQLGLVKGLSDGRFAPKESATRAEAVVIINRLYKLINVGI